MKRETFHYMYLKIELLRKCDSVGTTATDAL